MSSHRQIFKSTAIIGGTQIITLVFNILRNKTLALLLGPAGFGLAGLYMSAVSFVGAVAGLGLNTSGVRDIADAEASGDRGKLSRTRITLSRVSLVSGIFGSIAVIALASHLSRTTFGDEQHTSSISLMSLTLLFGSISAGQSALLQGLRQLRELALVQIATAIFATIVTVVLVYYFREDGIVPCLVAASGFALLASWYFSRKIQLPKVSLSIAETLAHSKGLVRLGLAFTFSALITSFVAYWTRVIVQRDLGTDAVGIYTAAWTLSSYYVNFVLSAMGADLVPRLTSASGDDRLLNRLLNEQTETGILIALPGVLATITLAPWILTALYSKDFGEGESVVRWQIIGVFLRVLSWPLTFVLIAKGKSALFAVTEAVGWGAYLLIFPLCIQLWRLEGVGIAFLLLYVISSAMFLLLIRWMTGFAWSSMVLKVIGLSIALIIVTSLSITMLPRAWGVAAGGFLTVVAGFICLRTLESLLNFSFGGWIGSKLRRG